MLSGNDSSWNVVSHEKDGLIPANFAPRSFITQYLWSLYRCFLCCVSQCPSPLIPLCLEDETSIKEFKSFDWESESFLFHCCDLGLFGFYQMLEFLHGFVVAGTSCVLLHWPKCSFLPQKSCLNVTLRCLSALFNIQYLFSTLSPVNRDLIILCATDDEIIKLFVCSETFLLFRSAIFHQILFKASHNSSRRFCLRFPVKNMNSVQQNKSEQNRIEQRASIDIEFRIQRDLGINSGHIFEFTIKKKVT